MSVETIKKKYDPEQYWAERYAEIDLAKSGHADLPVVYNEWLYRRKKERLLQGLLNTGFNPKGASVLEIAAGTGVYVEMWERLGVAKLCGIDISQNATDTLAARFPRWSFHKRDLAQPELASLVGSGYDLVTAVDMLYHIVDDDHFPIALRNLAETCRPGGWFAIHDFFMHHREMDFGYIKLRTLKAYEAALEEAGFEIVTRTPTFFLTVQTYDFKSLDTKKNMEKLWSRLIHPFISRSPELAGRLGYYSDKLLGSILREGPSFEMMICRRKE